MTGMHVTATELRSFEALSAWSDDAISDLAAQARPTDARYGDMLLREGAVAQHAFIIRTGHAEVFVDGELFATVGPGAVIGNAADSCQPAAATVRAVTAMELIALGPDALPPINPEQATRTSRDPSFRSIHVVPSRFTTSLR